jgi:predicted alpha/beta-hydrolase family hydrolase
MVIVELETPQGRANAHVEAVADARAAIVLGHGAGGGIAARDLTTAASTARSLGITSVLVEQPYRVAGKKAPPRAPQLDAAWIAVIDHLRAGALRDLPLIVGGRSSGARVACRTAEATTAVGVLCLAFPLRPPRREGAEPAPSRLPELEAVRVPILIVQGVRDPFGMPPEAEGRVVLQVDGDHSLRSGHMLIATAIAEWLEALAPRLQTAGSRPGRRD